MTAAKISASFSAAPDRSVTLRDGAQLAGAGLIAADGVAEADKVAARYAVSITPHLARMIDPADAADPIARQFLPDSRELLRDPVEIDDPIGDDPHTPVKGITHRYPDRVLLKPIMACPVYCRFCFRREAVGPDGGVLSAAELESAVGYIRTRPEIWEVILTGGDPLMLSPRRLGEIMAALDAIPHVRIVRIHTRVPVADPDRIGDEMAAVLGAIAKTVYVSVHCNHPSELSAATLAACARLTTRGIPLISQTVLLKGINDDPAILEALMRALVEARILPYYIHHPDLAPGTAHFRLSLEDGRRIVRDLKSRVSGLCQPVYVLDIPGGYGKVPIETPHVVGDGTSDRYILTDRSGRTHLYPPPA